jgi:hypothetical protein
MSGLSGWLFGIRRQGGQDAYAPFAGEDDAKNTKRI